MSQIAPVGRGSRLYGVLPITAACKEKVRAYILPRLKLGVSRRVRIHHQYSHEERPTPRIRKRGTNNDDKNQ